MSEMIRCHYWQQSPGAAVPELQTLPQSWGNSFHPSLPPALERGSAGVVHTVTTVPGRVFSSSQQPDRGVESVRGGLGLGPCTPGEKAGMLPKPPRTSGVGPASPKRSTHRGGGGEGGQSKKRGERGKREDCPALPHRTSQALPPGTSAAAPAIAAALSSNTTGPKRGARLSPPLPLSSPSLL